MAPKQATKRSLLTVLANAQSIDVWDRDELLDLLHWQKQVVSVLLGLVCGVVPITGAQAFVLFGFTMLVASMMFYKSYLKVDEEEFGGHGALLGEGLAPSVGLYGLVWIISYTS